MGFANAAGVLRSSDCHREGNNGSDKREEQQQFGGQALHGFRFRATTLSILRIEQDWKGCKVRATDGFD
jgi:hypothetical protein